MNVTLIESPRSLRQMPSTVAVCSSAGEDVFVGSIADHRGVVDDTED